MDSEACYSCPRKCGAVRSERAGFCGAKNLPAVARAALHFGEEPCISGVNGSGTVFFCGCSLRCVFCQNGVISRSEFAGQEISVERLGEIMLELESVGAHNINLVTPTHFALSIAEALAGIELKIPVVYNSSGYENVDTLKMLEGKISIYMPDMKYSDSFAAAKYSSAPDYVETAKKAIMEMYRQTGSYVMGDDGLLKSGVLIRHLILPHNVKNTLGVIDWVAEAFPRGSVLFSLMSQYTPFPSPLLPRELQRAITPREYARVEEHLFASGIENGFVQELSSADPSFVPAFDLTGVNRKEQL